MAENELIVDAASLEIAILSLKQIGQSMSSVIASSNGFSQSEGESVTSFAELEVLLTEIGNTLFYLTENATAFLSEALEEFQQSDTEVASSYSAAISQEVE